MAATYRYVAITRTADMGRFVLHVGTFGETRDDVLQHALGIIDTQDMLSEEWARDARQNLKVLSISDARRQFSGVMREYRRLVGGNA